MVTKACFFILCIWLSVTPLRAQVTQRNLLEKFSLTDISSSHSYHFLWVIFSRQLSTDKGGLHKISN